MKFEREQKVELLTGKYKVKPAYFVCYTEKNGEVRAQVTVQTGLGWKTGVMKLQNIRAK